MNRILLTVSALVKDNLRNRFVIFWIIIFPIIITLLFGLVFGGFSSYFHVTVAVEGDYGLAKYLNTTEIFQGVTNVSLKYAVEHDYIYVKVNGSSFTIYTSKQNQEFVPVLESVIDEYYQKVNNTHDFTVLQISGYTYYYYLISGIIGIISLSNGILSTIGVSASYFRDRIIERLATSPLKSYEWVISLIIYVIIITLISTAAVIILGILFGFIPIIGIEFLGFLVISTLLFGGLGAIIYGLTPKDKIFLSEIVANVLVFPLMFLSNAFFPPNVYPPIVRIFVEYQPLSVIITIIRDLIVYGVSPNPILVSIVFFFTVLFLYAGGRLLKLREID
ncbi:MAG: ABC transporter permease [Saccharolobus sp.]|uniref:ABC transporter permease n=1 Tax=Saccharolobus TaxID=2100760 RepID=UPI001F0E9067|nr:ABC transporter permease [Saccharolobus shibatae]MCH4814261.1 ABC transporter permease [Saccharolobus shibatae]